MTSKRTKEVTYSSDGKRELTHRVESSGTSVEQVLNKLRDSSTSSPVLGKGLNLLSSGHLSGDE